MTFSVYMARQYTLHHTAIVVGLQCLFGILWKSPLMWWCSMPPSFAGVVAFSLSGMLFAGIYIGREFEQLSPHWKPGRKMEITWQAARQAGVPALVAAAVVLVVYLLRFV